MDFPAHELARKLKAAADLGLLQTEAHPLDGARFQAALYEAREAIDAYLRERG